jgi:hypothetical protein
VEKITMVGLTKIINNKKQYKKYMEEESIRRKKEKKVGVNFFHTDALHFIVIPAPF